MREIGSEFWDVPTTEKDSGLFKETTTWYLSGRSALLAVLAEAGGLRTAALPAWCCDSMIAPFVKAGIEVRFYPVYFDGGLKQEPRTDCDALLLMDYFGYRQETPDLSGYEGTVIRDVTHSLFAGSPDDADYWFGSLRKWCGVWTGGYAWTKDGRRLPMVEEDKSGYAALRETAMEQKVRYLAGEGARDKGYLDVFARAEDLLEDAGAAPAAPRDIRLARQLDAALIRKRRRENAAVLREAFQQMLLFPEMGEEDVPLFVPVLVPDGRRDALRKHLIDREIYCPVHWPVTECHQLTDRERMIYDNELSLVCDQRYTTEDMARIVDAVREF